MPEEISEIEILNREHALNGVQLVANVNIKAPGRAGTDVVGEVSVNGVVIDPERYAATYTATDAVISIRGLPVDSAEEELAFAVAFQPYEPLALLAVSPPLDEDAE